ncbi:MAG: F0F1 ATP synthase subunit A [Candidatus Eisenbacteria bacterium]|nr:F0F1 ATP synthase subunit A [Candidatus Latescibacterota bacterium]MBD3301496.1 F0F1 ATP synthase subunit A [Candidatus Eisenbacteria bacterium]
MIRRILPLVLFACLLAALGLAPGRTAGAETGHGADTTGAQHATREALEETGGIHAVTEETHAEAEEPHGQQPVIELPNFLHILEVYFGGPSERAANWIDYLAAWSGPFFAILILLLITILLLRGASRREMIPGGFQNLIETVVEGFYNFVHGILGHHAKEFAPFLGTLFLYIWFMNLAGLVPLLKAPTSAFETTLALAIVVFLYVQFTGFRRLGVGGYLYHLVGSPRDVMGWCMVPLMLPLHIIGELAKPVSLSLRLFGNIMGEDVLIAVFTWLGVLSLAVIGSPVGIPFEFPFIFLGLLLSTIQALVFTLLSTIYFSQMLPHEEEHA